MRRLLFIVIAAMGMFKGHSQALVQTYVDRCTGQVHVFSVPMNGATSVAFYNKSRTFTAQQFQNGELQAWLEQTYQWWQALSPCSTNNATSQTTQQTTSQATTNATNAASNATSGATQNTGTANTGTTNTGSTNTNTNGNTGSTNTGSTGSTGGDGSNSGSSGSSSGSSSSGSSGGDSGGTSSGSGDSSGGDQGGSTDNSSGSGDSSSGDNSSDTGSDSSGSDNSSGDGDSGDGDSSGGSSDDQGGENSEDSSGESSDESKNEESKEEEVKEEQKEEESKEEKSDEESDESKEEDSEEEKDEEKSDDEESEDDEEEDSEEKSDDEGEEEDDEDDEKERNLAPPIVSANLVTMQMIDGVLTNAASFGYSQSSLTGETTYAANAMVWSNMQQFSLNFSKSTVLFNWDRREDIMVLDPFTQEYYKFGEVAAKGSIYKVQSISAGYMKMFSTHIFTAGVSDVFLGQKENWLKGFVGGYAITGMGVLLDGGQYVGTAAFTAFGTKPFTFKYWDRLTISPMLAYSMTPASYDSSTKNILFNKYGNYVIGSNFDFNLTQRFKANIGGTIIGSTMPQMPLSWALTVGSRFQF